MKKSNDMARAIAFLRATGQIERHRVPLVSNRIKVVLFWSGISFFSGFAVACIVIGGI